MALSLAECDAMVEACDRNGVKLAINHIKRASSYNIMVRHLIESGDIGDAWADGHAGVKPEIYEYCYQLGTNVINYAHAEYSKWLEARKEKK